MWRFCMGGGVDGVIYRVAESQLLAECMKIAAERRLLSPCPTSDAVITGVYQPSLHIYYPHCLLWEGQGEAETLTSCYCKCLLLAAKTDLVSVAFPNIQYRRLWLFPRIKLLLLLWKPCGKLCPKPLIFSRYFLSVLMRKTIARMKNYWHPRWLSLSKPPFSLAFSNGGFDRLSYQLQSSEMFLLTSSENTTTATSTEINFQILTSRWLSLSKPPSSLAFSYGRFNASTSPATTSSTTVSTGTQWFYLKSASKL